MIRQLLPASAALLLVTAAQAADPAAPIHPSKIILIGDSTMQQHSGWGGSFCAEKVVSIAACLDLGRGGRSTKSYRAEGSWAVALSEMRVKGYVDIWVLIQFGHNDQPGKPGRSTDIVTEFPVNLRRYVSETRAAGAKPILVTPLTRRMFVGNTVTNDLDRRAAVIRAVAAEMKVPLVDLNARSKAIVQAMGPAMAAHLAMADPSADIIEAALNGTTIEADKTPLPALRKIDDLPPVGTAKPTFDYTHLNRGGADLFASVVADELARQVPAMRPLLVP